jgi:hypothetical protein
MKGVSDIVAADTTGEQEKEKDTGNRTSPTHDEIIGPNESDAE